MKDINGLRQEVVRRGGVGPLGERLQPLQDKASQRMSDAGGVQKQLERGYLVRLLGVRRELSDKVQELLIREAHGRPTQKGSQSQRVPVIRQDAGQGNRVLNLLAAEEALSRLGRNRDAVALQGLLVAPEVRSTRSQQGDITRPTKPPLPCRVILDQLTSDQAVTQVGDSIRLGIALLVRTRFVLGRGHRTGRVANSGAGRRIGCVDPSFTLY